MNFTDRYRDQLPGLGLGLLFFLAGLPALRHFGVTWDEPESFTAAAGCLRILVGFFTGNPVEFPWRELPGYHFVIDVARGLFALIFSDKLGFCAEPAAHHFFNLCLSSAAVFLLYNLAFTISGSRRLGVFSALCLALFPRFIAHSQNNPKDLPALFAYVAVAVLVLHACRAGGRNRAVFAGLGLGLAFTTHILTAVLPLILLFWIYCCRRAWLQERRRELLIIGAVSIGTAFLTWPWLWPDPLGRLFWAFQHVRSFSYRTQVLYLGQSYHGTDMPWHYFIVSFAASTPVPLLLLWLAGVIRLLRGLIKRCVFPGRDLAVLGIVWCVPLILLEMSASSHYDGTRHLLMLIPGFCMLAACGLEWLTAVAASLRTEKAEPDTAGMVQTDKSAPAVCPLLLCRKRLHLLPAVILLGYLLAVNLRLHPYQDAYLNEVVNLLLRQPAEAVFEVEYWGNAFRAGAEWLNINAEPDAVVILPSTLLANYYLERPGVAPEECNFFDLEPPPKYVMYITRRAVQGDAILLVEEYFAEVFAVRRQKGTLLKIYRNRLR